MLDMSAAMALQRARGRAHVGFAGGAMPKLTDLHQSGCLKAMIPRNHAARRDVVFVNTAGGITGGDRLRISARLDDGAEACLTTQTAERIYRSVSGAGEVALDFEVGAGGALDWLPQETILFDGGALRRRMTVRLANDATALLLEPVVLGRAAMGETLRDSFVSDQWRVYRDGKLAFAEALRLTEPLRLGGPAALGDMRAFATLLYVGADAQDRLDQMRAMLTFDEVLSGASAWNGYLVTRLAATGGQPLRKALVSILSEFRAHTLPRVWHM